MAISRNQRRRFATLYLAATAFFGVSLISPTQLWGGALDLREIAITMESTLVDLDTTMIALHHGNDFASTLTYVSKIEETGWQGRLFGTYSGRTVDIYYTGVLTDIGGPTNAVTISYTSDWLYDGLSGTGSGSGQYQDPSFSFDIDLINMTVSGAISVQYGVASLTLSGVKDLAAATLTVAGTAAAVDVPLLGNVAEAELSLVYDQNTGKYESFATGRLLFGLYERSKQINRGQVGQPTAPPNPPPPPLPPNYVSPSYPDVPTTPGLNSPGPGYNNMTVQSIPEISASGLGSAAAIISCALSLLERRRFAKAM